MTKTNDGSSDNRQSMRERRQMARLPCEGATCQFGAIMDLSRTGARIVCKKPINLPEGACTHLKITAHGSAITLPAKAANARRRADGRYDVGFAFVGMTPETTKALVGFAMAAMPKPQLGFRRTA